MLLKPSNHAFITISALCEEHILPQLQGNVNQSLEVWQKINIINLICVSL